MPQEVVFTESSASKELHAKRILEGKRGAVARIQKGVRMSCYVLGTTSSWALPVYRVHGLEC